VPKKLTPEQAHEAREGLGLDTAPVEFEPRQPVPRAAIPTGAAIAAEVQRAASDTGPSIWEETKAAFRVDNSAVRYLGEEPEFPIDTAYSSKDFITLNKTRLDALIGADREEMAEEIGSAFSSEEAEYRLQNMEKDFEAEKTLYEGGVSALLLRMGAAVTDPTDLLAAATTGGTVGALVKAGKLGKIITGALSAGTASGTAEAILAGDNVFRDETDVAFATLAGITLGGALSSLSKVQNSNLNKAVEDLAADNIDGAAAKLGLPEDSAGAARRKFQSDNPNLPLKNTEEFLDDMEAPVFKYKGWNWLLNNLQSKLFYSSSDSVRKVSATMFEGGWLKNKTATRELTVEARSNQLQDVYERGIYAETLSNFKDWAKRNKRGSARRLFTTSVGEEFYSEVGLAMRGVTRGVSSEAAAAAVSIRKYMDNVHELAQRSGVKGFDKAALEDYFPRMINNAKFTEIRTRIGDDALTQFYTDAILRGSNEGLTDELAARIARGYVRVMRTKAAGIENDLLHGIRMDDVDKLREIFEGYDGLDKILSEIENIKAKELAERGTVSFGKRRIQFDETYEDLVKGFDGQTTTLRFTDLYENDARLVLTRYGRAMHGHIAMAEKLGVKSRGEFEELKQNMASDIEIRGGSPKQEIQAIEDGYNLLLGQPIERWNPSGDAAKMSRTISGYNYSTRGGQFGVNALAEAGNIIGQSGWRSLTRIFPDFTAVMKRGKDGELEHKLARFAELTFAPGITVLTKPAVRNLDELAEDFAGTSIISKFTAKMDPFIKSAGRATSLASGLGPITDATQRLAAIGWIDKLSRFANGAKISDGQLSRLRAQGINAEMQERIFAMFRKDAAGVYRGNRLVDIDVDKWVDEEALDVFSQAASREVRNQIQLPDISTSTLLFNHPAGRLLFQFMRFPMDAVNKQLLRGIHHADAETVTAWTASFGIGALAYIGQTSIEYANDPEERAKRLAPDNVAKVGFMRTGFSSMLPAPIDTGLTFLGLDPQFSLGRSSGLATAFPLTSNPTISTLKNLNRGVGGAVRAALHDDVQYSQGDFRSAAQLAPGYRLLGIKNIQHALEQQFPESREQK
jgi:hypothetical protein